MAALLLPMRPLKLRLAVETTLTPSAGMEPHVPQQEPQPGVPMTAPMEMKSASEPSRARVSSTVREAGVTTSWTLGAGPPLALRTDSA